MTNRGFTRDSFAQRSQVSLGDLCRFCERRGSLSARVICLFLQPCPADLGSGAAERRKTPATAS